MKSTSYSQPLLALIICVLSIPIPPLSGFTASVYMSGYAYGFPQGVMPATLGAFFGALLAYGFVQKVRIVCHFKVSDSLKLKFGAVSRAIGQGGLKMVLLIRFSPLPWQITNLLLALCEKVNFRTYALAAFISSFKINADVWFGSQLASLYDQNSSPEALKLNQLMTIAGIIITTMITLLIYKSTKQRIKECEDEQVALLGQA
jgi:uncharacterized membrane protein YdjX (TVP38/TMEM64 family)